MSSTDNGKTPEPDRMNIPVEQLPVGQENIAVILPTDRAIQPELARAQRPKATPAKPDKSK